MILTQNGEIHRVSLDHRNALYQLQSASLGIVGGNSRKDSFCKARFTHPGKLEPTLQLYSSHIHFIYTWLSILINTIGDYLVSATINCLEPEPRSGKYLFGVLKARTIPNVTTSPRNVPPILLHMIQHDIAPSLVAGNIFPHWTLPTEISRLIVDFFIARRRNAHNNDKTKSRERFST